MTEITTKELRLDVELMVNQLTKTADRFGHDLEALLREGVSNKTLRIVQFELIRDVSATSKEIHAVFAVAICYKADGGAEFAMRWRADDGSGSGSVESVLCDDFSGVINQLLQLAANAPACYWISSISAGGVAGDALCKRYGYTGSRADTTYVDATDPIGPSISNSVCSGLTANVRASSSIMDKQLK